MAVLGSLVSLRRRIPSAVPEGLDGLPAVVGGLAGHDCFKSCEGRCEPRLTRAQLCDLQPSLPGGRDTDGHCARSDQNELANAFWVAGHIENCEIRATAVREQV